MKGRLGLLRLVNSYLYGDDLAETPDEGEAIWTKVNGVLGRKGESTGETHDDAAQGCQTQSTPKASPTPPPPTPPPTSQPTEGQWRREFKTSGQIGEATQRDKLSYTSLIHQLERGSSNGYNREEKITEAIISKPVKRRNTKRPSFQYSNQVGRPSNRIEMDWRAS